MSSGSAPTINFSYVSNIISNKDGTYTVSGGTVNNSFAVQDIADSQTDNLTQIGDIQNDTFKITLNGSSNPVTYTLNYNAETADKQSLIGTLYGNQYLFTNNSYADGDNITTDQQAFAVCYCTGTLILTSRGNVAVEALKVGDLAVTASGEHRPIRWIGSRVTDTRRHPNPNAVMPVRIRAGGLGENRPARDLVVSPGHAICLDVLGEVLIPASALVNGATIVQEDVDSVTYWHVELDSHDLLIAEGQAAESYLDMGNRAYFADGDVVSLDATPDADAAVRTHADFCRPYHAGGALIEVVRSQAHLRAQALGWTLATPETWADVHLEVDGAVVLPKTRGLTASFVLPADARDVWLVCPTSVPCQVSEAQDRRALGLSVSGLSLADGFGAVKAIELDDPLLGAGFHEVAPGHRWTKDRAQLPAALLEGLEGDVFLRVDLGRRRLPRWIAPETTSVAEIPHVAPRLKLVAA